MRRLLVIVVVFVAFALPQASANSPSPAAGEKIVYSSMRGPNVNNAEIYSIGVDGSGRRNLSRNQGNEAALHGRRPATASRSRRTAPIPVGGST